MSNTRDTQSKASPAVRHTSPSARPSSSGAARPSTAGAAAAPQGPPWIPNGVRPHSPPRNIAAPVTGTRRNRAVEHAHVFLDAPELPPDDPANFCWLYGAYDFKLQCPPEVARQAVFKIIDRLVERMTKMNPPPPPPTMESFRERFGADPRGSGMRLGGSGDDGAAAGGGQVGRPLGGPNSAGGKQPRAPHLLKGSLIFDIISTKKHIGAVPEDGLPFRLGREIYRYVDATHGESIVTTFVGLTDNTARRVGRDIYYSKSEELSKNRFGFDYVDREHMFIIFPDTDARVATPDGASHNNNNNDTQQSTLSSSFQFRSARATSPVRRGVQGGQQPPQVRSGAGSRSPRRGQLTPRSGSTRR